VDILILKISPGETPLPSNDQAYHSPG